MKYAKANKTPQVIVLIIKIPEIIAKIFAINNCERASYFFGLCEYSVNKKISIEEKMISVREHSH
jgi:hypothetical protein